VLLQTIANAPHDYRRQCSGIHIPGTLAMLTELQPVMGIHYPIVMANHRSLLTADELLDCAFPGSIGHGSLAMIYSLSHNTSIRLLVVDDSHSRLRIVLEDLDHLSSSDLDLLVCLISEAELCLDEGCSDVPLLTSIVLQVDDIATDASNLTRVVTCEHTPDVNLGEVATVGVFFNSSHLISFGDV